MKLLTIILYVLGGTLLSAGVTVIVLTYATKVFHTKVTGIKAGASDPGLDLYRSAFIIWDETNQTFNSSGNFTKWTSNSTYADTVGGAQYAYELLPRTGAMNVRTSNSGTKGIVPSTSVAVQNYELVTKIGQALASFPQSNLTIILVGSGPVTEIPANSVTNGMSIRYGNLSMGVSFNFNEFNYRASPGNVVYLRGGSNTAIQPIQAPATFKTYTASNSQTFSANTLGITYTTSTDKTFKLYMNGQKVTFNTDQYKLTDDKLIAPIEFNFVAPIRFQVGSSDIYASSTSAYYAILVFNRVLSDAEMVTLNAYLSTKYFAPKLTYPTAVTLTANVALSAPIANTLVSGADPIQSYSITPTLPAGLVFNTTSGAITGTPTTSSAARDYTITATNAIMSNTYILSLTVAATTTGSTTTTGSAATTNITRQADPVPNISIPETRFIFPLMGNVTTSSPTNAGGPITGFTIDPANITEITGLTFDATKGVLSGAASHSAIVNVSITASNNSGTSVLTFKLITGQVIEYSTSSIQSTVGNTIQNMPVAIYNSSGVSITFSSTGDLLGLTVDPMTGSISGTTNMSGKSTVTINAKTTGNTVFASTQITLDVQPAKELKNKTAYLASGGATAGMGAIALGVAGYLTYSSIHSTAEQTPQPT